MGGEHKKKLKSLDFDRVGRIAKYFHQKPSSYLPQLDIGEALMLDEMCIIIMERNNKIYHQKYKEKEAEKKKEKEWQNEMDNLFLQDCGEII